MAARWLPEITAAATSAVPTQSHPGHTGAQVAARMLFLCASCG